MPANEVLVTIAVDQQTKKLSLYPAREGEVVVFKKFEHSHPERPTQVRWTSIGLQEDQTIRIEAKDQAQKTFGPNYALTNKVTEKVSGEPNKDKGPNALWSYTIFLMENDVEKDKIDPDITIKDDP